MGLSWSTLPNCWLLGFGGLVAETEIFPKMIYIYQDSENDSMLHDIEREIPEFIVRFNDNSSPCLTSPWSRSSSTVRSKQLEINSEGGICENVVEVVSPPHSQNNILLRDK